jgi:TM2 domain-containing membrane protein YozV
MTDKIYIQKKLPKSPAAAGILSGFFPGAGQLYNGEPSKALLFFIIFAGCISMMPHGPHPFLPLVFAGFYFYQIIEAVQTAKAINERALADDGTAGSAPGVSAVTPAKAERPFGQNSAFAGLILMGVGTIFLLGNFNIINFDRIFDYWPVLIIVIGLKMLVDYGRKRD